MKNTKSCRKYTKTLVIPALCILSAVAPKEAKANWGAAIGYLIAGAIGGTGPLLVSRPEPVVETVQPVYHPQPVVQPVSTPAYQPVAQTTTTTTTTHTKVVRRVVRRVVPANPQQPLFVQHVTPQGQVYYTQAPVKEVEVIEEVPVTTQPNNLNYSQQTTDYQR